MTTTFEAGTDASQEASAPAVPMAARTRGLRKVYGRTVAVDHVDLDVPEGAVLGMLGPNGSGKTTTIRMLLGLVRPTEGEVELFGKKMPDEAAHALPGGELVLAEDGGVEAAAAGADAEQEASPGHVVERHDVLRERHGVPVVG